MILSSIKHYYTNFTLWKFLLFRYNIEKMEQIPDKILAVLDVLDEESASIVVINNLPNFSPEAKAVLRTQFLNKNAEVVKGISTFLRERDLQRLLDKLKSFLETPPFERLPTGKKSQKHIKNFTSLVKNNLTISTDINSKNELNDIEMPKGKQLPSVIQHEERKRSNTSLRESSSQDDSIKFTHTILTDLPVKENEDASSKTMTEDSKILFLALSEQENKPELFKTFQEAPPISSPRDFAAQTRKREQKIKDTDSQFKMILEESKVFVQTRALSPRSPHYQTINNTTCIPKGNSERSKPEKDFRIQNQFEFSACKPFNLNRIALSQHNADKIAHSTTLLQDNPQVQNTLISEESNESGELEATPTTEELFKKYILEASHEDKKINPILELSFSSMLRYIDFDQVMLKLKENSTVSQINFITIVREELRKQFKKITLSNESIDKLSQVYQIIFSFIIMEMRRYMNDFVLFFVVDYFFIHVFLRSGVYD